MLTRLLCVGVMRVCALVYCLQVFLDAPQAFNDIVMRICGITPKSTAHAITEDTQETRGATPLGVFP